MADYPLEPRSLSSPNRPLPPRPDAAAGAGTVSIGQFLGVIRRHMWMVLGLAALGLLGGGFLAYRERPMYQAQAVLRLSGDRNALAGGTDPASTSEAMRRTTDPMKSFEQLVRSKTVLGMTVDSVGLQLRTIEPKDFPLSALENVQIDPRVAGDTIQIAFGDTNVAARVGTRAVRAAYGQPLTLGAIRFTVPAPMQVPGVTLRVAPREAAIDGLSQALVVKQRPGTDIIDVIYLDPDPLMAQRVVNTTVKAFTSTNIRSAQEKSRRQRQFLAEQVKAVDSQLTRAQAQLSAFRSRREFASAQSNLGQRQEAMLALDSRLGELDADRRTYGDLATKLKSGNDAARGEALRALATSPAMGSNPNVANLYTRLQTYQDRLDSMTTGPWRSAPTNPDVVQLNNLVGQTKQQLTQAVNGQVASLDSRIGALSGLRNKNSASIAVLPALAAEEDQLARDVQRFDSRQDKLQQEYEQARLAEAIEAGDMDVVDLAQLPYAPVWATGPIKTGLGLLLGLLLGAGGAFLLEMMNKSIRRPEELENLLHVPGLAVIPRLSATPQLGKPRLAGLLGSGRNGSADQGRAAALGTVSQPFSVGTEAFRMLRTSLVWSEKGEQLRTLVVTSAAPGEGKTLTAANLAVSFAYDGQEVLLVDCDIRRPRLHGMFRVPRSPGLMELLGGSGGETGGVQSVGFDPGAGGDIAPGGPVIQPTMVRGLSLLTCGSLPTNASDLLSGSRLRALLKTLGRTYDLIILDTPPVLATADAGILGAFADGVLLVVRAGQTERLAARRAHQQLMHVGARVLGAVLNDPGGELAAEGEYYYPYDYAAERE